MPRYRGAMEIVPSTALALLAALVIALRGPARGLPVILAIAPFGAAAAFNLPAAGGASILVLDVVVAAAFALVLLSPDGPGRIVGTFGRGPGLWMLGVLTIGTVSALFLPTLFAGETTTFAIARNSNGPGIVEVPLAPSNGNLTQLFRLLLGGLAFAVTATILRGRPDAGLVLRAMAWATAVHVALGWIDVASWRVGLRDLLDPIRSANYSYLDHARMGGIKRMVGGFPEASAYGGFSLLFFGFWLHLWMRGIGGRLAPVMLILATLAVLRSTSSAAYVAMGVFILLYASLAASQALRRAVSEREVTIALSALLAGWGLLVAVAAAYELVPSVTAFVDSTLIDKLSSSSGVERMGWNGQAWQNFVDTWGLGAGLGSVRASSWLLACLGSMGLLGTALFLGFLISLARLYGGIDPARRTAVSALLCGCAVAVIEAMLTRPTPDMGLMFFLMAGMAAGLSRGAEIAEGAAAMRPQFRRPRPIVDTAASPAVTFRTGD